ncbi:Ubiquitin-like-specific protease 1 [Madurella mycetomatis]|uniref:Ubiquitin-like-specific protease 1 n=1 Tax=Madurella mycetomatis TaxID=100816 RepID=A0A175VW41_9PEZI|nr:Ubiquitin-like-specific protease 1 [Madurella mycetomatis]
MPNQASTPRPTRNSRGFRQSPTVSSSVRVSGSRRSSGTPTRARVVNALAPFADAQPDTPTPNARFTRPKPQPAQTPALRAIQEEQVQPSTPIPASRLAAARPSIFPPPVALPPFTPNFFTPQPRTPSPLEHPRVSSIKQTPGPGARKSCPWTPVRYPTRYRTRYVDATPLESPSPESPALETRRFRQRRDEEGDENFARELWLTIRNDHYMRGCWCGPPNIYNSREEAETAVGHLRFYIDGPESKNLRVIQRKDDFGWHCCCGNSEYPAVYKDLINSNGKRPAEDSEIDLTAQNQGVGSAESVERFLPELGEPTTDGSEEAQTRKLARVQSMWAQARRIISRAVATMGGSVAILVGKLCEQFRGDAYETIDTRRKDAQQDIIIVKRLKRQARVPSMEGSSSDDGDDGFEDLVWADDPTKRIGLEQIQNLANSFVSQLQSIKTGSLVGGTSIADIQMQIQPGQDLGASIAVHRYQEQKYGPMLPEEPDHEKADKLLKALVSYQKCLAMGINFMQATYDPRLFEELKKKHKTLPRRLALGGVEFRQGAKMVGEFLCFLQSLKTVCSMDPDALEAICKMIVDANAIHKREMVPSFVELKHSVLEDMPGFFPEERASIMEEIPADELYIEPLYDFKYPSPEPSDWENSQGKPGDYRLVSKPKGILKPSTEWVDAPTSPRYVPTPQKKRRLAFESPISKFTAPAHIPAKVMTPGEADQLRNAKLKAEVLRDERSIRMYEAARKVSRKNNNSSLDSEDKWSREAIDRDDEEMGLAYHARKYGGFLDDLQNDMLMREEGKQNERPRHKPSPHMVRIPLPPLPSNSALRRRTARMLESPDTGSPAAPSPGPNPLLARATEDEPPKVKKAQPAYSTLEEFFAADKDDLEISTAKLEQLEIDRQVRSEFEAGLRRQVEEKRQREIEEERRRIAEERRRKEVERRREEEARKRKEAEELAALTGLRRPIRPLITPMSDEWDLKVISAARANPAAELVKTLEGQPLTRRDFEEKLLPPTAWLNDNVIIGSILHISDYVNTSKGATNQEPKCAAFTSYFWPRLLSHGPSNCGRLLRRAGVRKANFLDIDSILIPICEHSHWTLAVIRPGRRTVAHLDSMRAGHGHENVKAKLLELVRFILEEQFVEAEWQAVDYEAPRQTNGWDCGVFTITNAMCVALGLDPKQSYSERQLTLQRKRVAAVLLNEGFKGEFSLDGF